MFNHLMVCSSVLCVLPLTGLFFCPLCFTTYWFVLLSFVFYHLLVCSSVLCALPLNGLFFEFRVLITISQCLRMHYKKYILYIYISYSSPCDVHILFPVSCFYCYITRTCSYLYLKVEKRVYMNRER